MISRDRAITRLKKQVEELSKAESNLTVDDLLDIVNVGDNLHMKDYQTIKRACQSAETLQFEIVYSIIQGEELSNWIYSDAPTALFVEGAMSCSFDRNTPLSFLCTELIGSLRDQGPAAIVHFFCGPHTSMKDLLPGPIGLIRSLLAQVIHLYPPVLDFISRRVRSQLEGLHLGTLCDCFCRLVRKMPADTVVICIIDGISFFETREWISGCREIMSQLRGLLDEDVIPVFKLLVTSPVRSRYLGGEFSESNRLKLSLGSENTRSGPTEREIAIAGTRQSRVTNARAALRQSTMRRRTIRGRDTPVFTESEWDEDGFVAMDLDSDSAGLAGEMSYARLDSRSSRLKNV